MTEEMTYDQAFAAAGGQKLEKNTVQGRKERAERRAAYADQEQDNNAGEGDEEDDGDEA